MMIFHEPGFFGVVFWAPKPHSGNGNIGFVIKDTTRHPLLFSEREGMFLGQFQVGKWTFRTHWWKRMR